MLDSTANRHRLANLGLHLASVRGGVHAFATVFLEPLQKKENLELIELLEEMKLLRVKIEALEGSNQRILSQEIYSTEAARERRDPS